MTQIYYKEVDGKYILIDGLFLPKRLTGDVPEDKETGIVDNGRDLSNIFELHDPATTISAAQATGEATNIYVADGPGALNPTWYKVIGERDQGKQIWSSRVCESASWTYTLPVEYRNRTVFMCAFWDAGPGGDNGSGPTIYNAAVRGKFIHPGASGGDLSLRFDHRARPRRNMCATYKVKIFEVEQESSTVRKGDLSNIFAAKETDVKIPWWWHVLKADRDYFGVDCSGTATYSIPFNDMYTVPYAYINAQKNNDDYYQYIHTRTKPFGRLTLIGNGSYVGGGHLNFGLLG